jgi:hypothetical protein
MLDVIGVFPFAVLAMFFATEIVGAVAERFGKKE